MRSLETGAKTQDDLVAARIPAMESEQVEEMTLPGLQLLHTMRDSEIAAFFETVLKSRQNIIGIYFSFGDYKVTEARSSAARANALHTLSYGDVATLLTSILVANPKCVGFKATIFRENDVIASKVFSLLADKSPTGPVLDEQFNVIESGDPEFNPVLRLTYRLT